MDRRKAARRSLDELDTAKDQIIAYPIGPLSDSSYLAIVNSELDSSQYVYTNPLNSPVMDDSVYDSFSFIPPRLLASGSSNHGVPRYRSADWPAPSYFEEAPSSAAFASFEPLSGRDFVSPCGWVGETDRELFSPNTDDFPSYMAASTPPLNGHDTQPSHSDRSTPVPLPLSSLMASESMDMSEPPMKLKVKLEPEASGPTGRAKPVPAANGLKADGGGRTRKVKLRTASRKAKHTRKPSLSSTPSSNKSGKEEEDDGSLSPEERKARRSHNIVEKKYRYRLNAQFERLLAALPADDRIGDTGLRRRGSGDSGDDGAVDDRRLSKAEVLDLATRRIKILERETMLLQKDRDMLMQTVDTMSKDRR